MIQQNVIDKTTKIVKRAGYCDFEHDGSFNPDTEEIITMNFTFNPPLEEQAWEYDGETFVEAEE